jgi:hypothetical protein
MTPEELEKQRKQEADKRAAEKRKLALQATLAAGITVGAAAASGPLDRINQTINTKIEALKSKAVSSLLSQASKLGITGLESGNPQLPDSCPSPAVLREVLAIRDGLKSDIEQTAKYINVINISLGALSPILNGTLNTLSAINIVKTAASLANKFIPLVPGAAVAVLNDLDDIRTILTFDTEGNPRLPKLKRAIQLGSEYVAGAAVILQTILILLDIIDSLLKKCGETPSEIGSDVTTLLDTVKLAETSNIQSTYQGFTFEIIEKPFSPTVNRKIAQAKNSQGIVLLQTEPSFTQNPQVLIEELKLIINRDNLKAN